MIVYLGDFLVDVFHIRHQKVIFIERAKMTLLGSRDAEEEVVIIMLI